MPETNIKINDKQIIAKIKKVSKGFRFKILEALAQDLDNIRFRSAIKYLIPRRGPAGISPTKLKRYQPADPNRLTVRTGFLKRILDTKGNWSIPKTGRSAKLKASQYLNANVKADLKDLLLRNIGQ